MAIDWQPASERKQNKTHQASDNRGARRAPWRETVQMAARQAAEDEARQAWKIGEDEIIPFNYRWEHAQQVTKTALWLAQEVGADLEVAEAAGWLHDVRKIEDKHAVAGAAAAREILHRTDFPTEKVEAVCTAIFHHEGLMRKGETPLEPLDAAVLWDADKLTKLGVQALIYNVSTPRQQGYTLAERLARAKSFTDTVLSQTVVHMNTSPAKALAARRYAEMVATLGAWQRDTQIESETRSSL